jgi:hypothetical protein
MSKHDEVLSALRSPVRRRELLQGRSAAFRIAYRKLVRTGQIVERGIGGRGNPVYSGLPTAVFPVPRYIGGINHADLALLLRSGMSEADGRAALQAAIDAPGDNTAEISAVLDEARVRIAEQGGNPWENIPTPPLMRGGL